jgi:alkylation response protein AidB-like acyl-CoA dehydrogenase
VARVEVATPVAELSLLNNYAETFERVAAEAMQVLGGAGYLQGSKVERLYRETKRKRTLYRDSSKLEFSGLGIVA